MTSHRVSFVVDDTWNEYAVNWENKPAAGISLDSEPIPFAQGDWIEFDVTDQTVHEICGDGTISFMVREADSNKVYATYHSKESPVPYDRPKLIILLKGDLNLDGKVNLSDHSVLADGWQILYDIQDLWELSENWLYGMN